MNLSYLVGVWYIVFSNFAMWTKGDKLNPTFNYQMKSKNGIIGLSDEVKFLKNGKPKSIKGWDKPLNQENTKFTWRGSGILFFTKSKWEIIFMSDDRNWMIIHFEKTMFTPEGYDVVCRNPNEIRKYRDEINRKLSELKISDLQEIKQ